MNYGFEVSSSAASRADTASARPSTQPSASWAVMSGWSGVTGRERRFGLGASAQRTDGLEQSIAAPGFRRAIDFIQTEGT